jgi:uncharacterized protein YjbI with pentapeptide repeats/voltage-gated potassium channel Kch
MKKEEKHSTKCPICGRPTHKESKYCIFHASAQEKTEKEFREALKDYVDKIIRESRVFNFEKFIFIGEIDFSKDFNLSKIHKCNFKGTEFYYGKVRFDHIEFSKETKFIDCKFKSKVSFVGSEFRDNLYIGNVHFFDQVNFNKATFHSFEIKGTTFEGGMNSFNEAHFFGDFLIESCRFMHDIDFIHSVFSYNVKMGGKEFNNSIFNFERADINSNFEIFFNSIEKIQIKLNNITINPSFTKITITTNNAGIYFNNANLEKTELVFELYNDSFIDFQNVRMKDTFLRYDHIKSFIIQENRKNYEQAREVYLTLKNNFHSIGRYNDESSTYKKEMDMERKSHWISNMKNNRHNLKDWLFSGHFWAWFSSAFTNMIYSYGERPYNVIKTALAIILIFAFSFSFIGLGNPEIIELKGTAIHQNSGNIVDLVSKGFLKNNTIRNFPDSLYFSTITFTTLGYGDFRPLEGWGRILAGLEAFIGAFMMALFVYTFARRTGGR